jgi:hypothetical protein
MHRVVAEIVQVSLAVLIVADDVVVKPLLPDAAVPVSTAVVAGLGFCSTGGEMTACESCLEPPHPTENIGIPCRQLDHEMQVIRQQHDGGEAERLRLPRGCQGRSQSPASGRLKQNRPAMVRDERQKPLAPLPIRPPIVRHEAT